MPTVTSTSWPHCVLLHIDVLVVSLHQTYVLRQDLAVQLLLQHYAMSTSDTDIMVEHRQVYSSEFDCVNMYEA